MAMFGSRLRAVPFVEDALDAGGVHRPDPSAIMSKEMDAMKNAAGRGMFGSAAPGRGEKMMLLGAMLQDAGAALRGGRGGAMAALAEMIEGRRQQEAMAQQAEALNLSDRERFLLSLDPEGFGKVLQERLTPRVVSQGGAVYQDGAQAFYNPEVGVDGGFAFTQTPEGIQWGEQRPMSHSEQTSRELGEERIAAMKDRYEALERQADERIGLSRQREGRIAGGGGRGGGSGGNPRAKLPAGFILD